jgi:hypothetical protein
MPVAPTVLVVLALGLLVTAVLLVRSPSRLPWPAILVAALTAGICFTVGGGSGEGVSGPDAATVAGSVAGFASVLAAVLSLAPGRSRPEDARGPRAPIMLSTAGIAIGALGLLLSR